jgi:hypothetical protein
MFQIRCNGCYRRLKMWWYGPAVLAVVLFSQSSIYIFRPGTLASMLGVALHFDVLKSFTWSTHICLSSHSTTCPVCATKRLVYWSGRGASTCTSSVLVASGLRAVSLKRSRGRFRLRRISFRFGTDSSSSLVPCCGESASWGVVASGDCKAETTGASSAS